MKRLILLLCVMAVSHCFSQLKAQDNLTPELEILRTYMEGSFSSKEQSLKDSTFVHINLNIKRIWNESTNGLWLYVEQAFVWAPNKPYRQRVYHIEQVTVSEFKCSILKLPNPQNYIGAYDNLEAFNKLAEADLEDYPGCALFLNYSDACFSGGTTKNECLNSLKGASYASSEVRICEGYMETWDRGWNASHQQVWGSTNGAYIFAKSE